MGVSEVSYTGLKRCNDVKTGYQINDKQQNKTSTERVDHQGQYTTLATLRSVIRHSRIPKSHFRVYSACTTAFLNLRPQSSTATDNTLTVLRS